MANPDIIDSSTDNQTIDFYRGLIEDIQAYETYVDEIQIFLLDLKTSTNDPKIRERAESLRLLATNV